MSVVTVTLKIFVPDDIDPSTKYGINLAGSLTEWLTEVPLYLALYELNLRLPEGWNAAIYEVEAL